ncbi:MAG: MFS transporter [Woeseiaceae bacterium]
MTSTERWLVMVLMCLAGSVVFWGPFFADVFYVPMQEAFGFTNTQMGVLSSVFGTTSLIGYFPGGWIADRFAPRKLIAVSLLIVAAGGFVFWTIPSFEICLIVFGVWGFAITLMLWSAMIKAIRGWGSRNEQGRAFGLLEGGRNISDMTTSALLVGLFAYWGGDHMAVDEVILAQTLALPVIALLVWFYLEDDPAGDENSGSTQPVIELAQMKEVLKLPIVWLLSVIIMAAYYGYWGSYYFSAYAIRVLELGEVMGSTIGGAKYWIAPPAAIAAGFIADKIGAARAVVWSFVVMTIGLLVMGLTTGAAALLTIMLVNISVVAIAVFALRGIYFALMEQGKVPIAVTGTATGVVSVLGFTPDVFAPLMAGYLFDSYPGETGFRYYYLAIGAMSFVGLLASYSVYRMIAAQEKNMACS